MRNMFHALERAAIYAGAKPCDRPVRTMQIVKRNARTSADMKPAPAVVRPILREEDFLPLAAPTRTTARSTGLNWED